MALIPERRGAPNPLNVAKCLNDGVEAGRLTREGAERALAAVQRILDETPGIGEGAAMTRAAEQLQRDAARNRRQTALQVIAVDRALRDAEAHPDGFAAGVRGIFARDISGKGQALNVEGRAREVREQMHGMFADGLEAYRSTALGLRRDVLGLTRFVRQLYGEATGDGVATAAAGSWTHATGWAVDRFNAAGGAIAKRESWRLPQAMDAQVLRRMGRDRWLDAMNDRVADGRLRIMDRETGEPMTALRRVEVLSNAYKRISTNGLSDLVPGATAGGKLANSRSDPRVFEWTTADAWLDANRTFGGGDAAIYDAVVGHIQGMARDIAMLERLGPNPDRAARLLIDTAKQRGVEGMTLYRIEATWDHVTGAASSPVSEFWAGALGGVRAWLSAAQLGTAPLSSIADFSTMKAAGTWSGLDATRMIGHYAKLLASPAERMRAVRAGLGADAWIHRTQAAQRETMEVIGQTLPNRVAGFMQRASGMEVHTQGAKWAFGLEFLGHLADLAETPFAGLEPRLQRQMGRHGLDAEAWDLIRTRALTDEEGVRFIHPERLVKEVADRRALETGTRLMELINNETGFAVLEPGAAERALVLGKTRPGTVEGELLRTYFQYKSFPLTMLTRHAMRGIEAYRGGDHGRYMVSTAVSLTLAGALSSVLYDVVKGRDPRDMTTWRFWGNAFLRGGGAGILGDFLNASVNRADQGFMANFLGGPTLGLVDDVAKLTTANVNPTIEGRDAHWGRDLANFARRNTPGTSLWYARLALDRLLWDRLQELLDPDHARAFRRMEDRARRETGQRYYWGPGGHTPDRGPNMGAALGGSP